MYTVALPRRGLDSLWRHVVKFGKKLAGARGLPIHAKSGVLQPARAA